MKNTIINEDLLQIIKEQASKVKFLSLRGGADFGIKDGKLTIQFVKGRNLFKTTDEHTGNREFEEITEDIEVSLEEIIAEYLERKDEEICFDYPIFD